MTFHDTVCERTVQLGALSRAGECQPKQTALQRQQALLLRTLLQEVIPNLSLPQAILPALLRQPAALRDPQRTEEFGRLESQRKSDRYARQIDGGHRRRNRTEIG